jgi:hypothetical protein
MNTSRNEVGPEAGSLRQIAERDARINLLLAMASFAKAEAARMEGEIGSLKRQIDELQLSATRRAPSLLRHVGILFRRRLR